MISYGYRGRWNIFGEKYILMYGCNLVALGIFCPNYLQTFFNFLSDISLKKNSLLLKNIYLT